ncbi:hypothetical protein NQ038_08310 [Brevibacterium sp. 50QC2O2]|uniref:hypothetical protein n=1 Tax=Brevibacterium TaxID=1696 RepID=UPI00211D094E|nr:MULTISPECIES: hypothetical protein [unclassified Brevibacterium]MCQ9368577.1 hypothetical protein [Brevibacterium sp. 91QC2O2]MCQ9386257.1 hypothetical protein [Brevibacterium sp. 68QC2CO]MCQ9388648.1 hypothetical protein [Brevibacterium sp. 50QC2O2]
MSKCPLCCTEVPQSQYMWTLTGPGLESVVDPVLTSYYGRERSYAGLFPVAAGPGGADPSPHVRSMVESNPEVPAGVAPGVEVCPHCHYPLPRGWREADVRIVALCGAPASGKSLYIATVIKTLKTWLAEQGGSLRPADGVTAKNYGDRYEKPLFKEMGLMQATRRSDAGGDGSSLYQLDPLIFSISAPGDPRPRFLVLRDVAGEEMEFLPEDTTHLRFMAHADTVLFMFDPLSVDAIERRLRGLVPPRKAKPGNPERVLDNLLMMIGGEHTGAARAYPPRLGIALSKFDVLQQLAGVNDRGWSRMMSNAGAGFMRETSHPGGQYDLRDGNLLTIEARSLLDHMGAEAIVNKVEHPHGGMAMPYRYFVVSALGDSPQGGNVSKRGISPFRVLDPLIYAMSGN